MRAHSVYLPPRADPLFPLPVCCLPASLSSPSKSNFLEEGASFTLRLQSVEMKFRRYFDNFTTGFYSISIAWLQVWNFVITCERQSWKELLWRIVEKLNGAINNLLQKNLFRNYCSADFQTEIFLKKITKNVMHYLFRVF